LLSALSILAFASKCFRLRVSPCAIWGDSNRFLEGFSSLKRQRRGFCFCYCFSVLVFFDSQFVISMHSVWEGRAAKMVVGVFTLVGALH
jgi:hypothetical protein